MPGLTPEEIERLREASGLSLDRDGRFRHQGTAVEHPRVDRALRRGLGRARDGRPIVSFGPTWAYLAVADVLYRVRLARTDADGERLRSCHLVLDDDTEEPLDLSPGAVALDADGVFYLKVKAGREWARCLPAAHAALGAFVVEYPAGAHLVTVNGDLPLEKR